jgi:hypothetical protein
MGFEKEKENETCNNLKKTFKSLYNPKWNEIENETAKMRSLPVI